MTIAEDVFYDRSEFLKAAASPEYRESPRYRDEVAAKLDRSITAGRITPMGVYTAHHQRSHERIASNPLDGENGFTMPAAPADWSEAGKVAAPGSVFKSPEEIAAAFSAPAFEIDPSYQNAVREKVARSVREGWLTADLRASNPYERGV